MNYLWLSGNSSKLSVAPRAGSLLDALRSVNYPFSFSSSSINFLGLAAMLSGAMLLLMIATTSSAADSRGRLQTLQSSSSSKITKAAPAVCYAASENATEVMPVTVHSDRIAQDRSCYVSVISIQKELQTGQVALVDVRHPDAFNLYSIPASLNIPLFAVKTKTFLKGMRVILVNEGANVAMLEQTCSGLRRAGFSKISVMEGGLHAWVAQGGPITGDALAAVDQLKWLTPQDLFAEHQHDDWIVFDFSTKQDPAMRRWLPKKLESVKLNARTAATIKAVTAGKKGKNPVLPRILVVNERGAGYDKIELSLLKAGLKQIYYLQGGLTGYRDFLAQQTAMWNQKDKPLKLPACQS